MRQLIPSLPISMQELSDYYRIAARECDYFINHLHQSLGYLEMRMKPSPLVSVQFNKYESYYVSFLEHLRWRVSDVCVTEEYPFKDSKFIQGILSCKYKHSGIAHPINEDEIVPMLASLNEIKSNLENLVEEIEKSMLKSIFLCHASTDKPKVREIANQLTLKGSKVWLDEAEILVGDSILGKIEDGINNSDYLGIILSPDSVKSIWVKKEVEAALTQEINGKAVKVIPILLVDCDIPIFLKPKKYADFRTKESCEQSIQDLVKRLRV